MESASRPRRRTDVLAEFLADGSAVLYDPRTEIAYPLTATAAVVWETCDGAHTATTKVDELAALFEAPSEVIERDVQALLGQLAEIGLLDPSPGAIA